MIVSDAFEGVKKRGRERCENDCGWVNVSLFDVGRIMCLKLVRDCVAVDILVTEYLRVRGPGCVCE